MMDSPVCPAPPTTATFVGAMFEEERCSKSSKMVVCKRWNDLAEEMQRTGYLYRKERAPDPKHSERLCFRCSNG